MPVDLVTLRDPNSAAAEAFRTLRTNIQFSSLDRQLRTLLVTSAAAGEGKSDAIANLAVTMAQAELRVILVDCDLRRPALHTIFGAPNERGLTTLMLDETTAPAFHATEIEGLRLLPAGPLHERPADLLGSRRLEAVIERLKADADIVLFDAPPVITVTDAAVLATKVDGTLLVARAGKTRRDRAREAVQLLQKVNAHVIGVVLTNARVEKDTAY
ncbi:MAG TPA: CpsD/CapB family tyrosine-protein kinase [Herpetosiphonaceae bacterium]